MNNGWHGLSYYTYLWQFMREMCKILSVLSRIREWTKYQIIIFKILHKSISNNKLYHIQLWNITFIFLYKMKAFWKSTRGKLAFKTNGWNLTKSTQKLKPKTCSKLNKCSRTHSLLLCLSLHERLMETFHSFNTIKKPLKFECLRKAG